MRKYIVLGFLSVHIFSLLRKCFDPYSCLGLLRHSDFKGVGQLPSALQGNVSAVPHLLSPHVCAERRGNQQKTFV